MKFSIQPGEVVDLNIDRPGYELSVASFTIANAPQDEFLEFWADRYRFLVQYN